MFFNLYLSNLLCKLYCKYFIHLLFLLFTTVIFLYFVANFYLLVYFYFTTHCSGIKARAVDLHDCRICSSTENNADVRSYLLLLFSQTVH